MRYCETHKFKYQGSQCDYCGQDEEGELRARVAELEDRLTEQADAVASTMLKNADLRARVAELEAELDRLRELLRPAAAFADVLDSDEIFKEMREPETIIAIIDTAVLTTADCYAARAALKEDK